MCLQDLNLWCGNNLLEGKKKEEKKYLFSFYKVTLLPDYQCVNKNIIHQQKHCNYHIQRIRRKSCLSWRKRCICIKCKSESSSPRCSFNARVGALMFLLVRWSRLKMSVFSLQLIALDFTRSRKPNKTSKVLLLAQGSEAEHLTAFLIQFFRG